MKCLSCGSSVEATKENTCSYCGSVLRLETFTNLYQTSGKTKDLFKFSSSEQNSKDLSSEEKHSALHTEILLLFERKQWSDIERIAGTAKLDYPTDYKFSMYLIIAIIAQNKLQYKERDDINEITSALSNPSNSLSSENLRGFLIACINSIWHKTKFVKEVPVPKWDIDSEINGVLIFISIPKVLRIIESKKGPSSSGPPSSSESNGKTSQGNVTDVSNRIADLINETNIEIKKTYQTKKGIDYKIEDFFILTRLPAYKQNNLNELQELYERRGSTYLNLINELNYDYNEDKVNEKFNSYSNKLKNLSKGVSKGSYFTNLIIWGVLLIGSAIFLDSDGLIELAIVITPFLAFFGRKGRKDSKQINEILMPLSTSLDSELSKLKKMLISLRVK
ncbi:hypothetical protein OAV49_01080 [Alphaproteobacteria bacterium]|nr:hypothetical protein [Alphaproteobacteria bacterium]